MRAKLGTGSAVGGMSGVSGSAAQAAAVAAQVLAAHRGGGGDRDNDDDGGCDAGAGVATSEAIKNGGETERRHPKS